jgi:caffeoyl-CoA O-methyltransferase
MFQNIPEAIKERMRYLESINEKDRLDGTPSRLRLCQITPETGKFIALLAASAPDGKILEIGTSGGYSTLWLSLACKERERKIITFEVLED